MFYGCVIEVPFSKDDRWTLLRFVIVAFDFHCTNDYIMVSNMFLLVIDFIRFDAED
jgi:hypothetical protein